MVTTPQRCSIHDLNCAPTPLLWTTHTRPDGPDSACLHPSTGSPLRNTRRFRSRSFPLPSNSRGDFGVSALSRARDGKQVHPSSLGFGDSLRSEQATRFPVSW